MTEGRIFAACVALIGLAVVAVYALSSFTGFLIVVAIATWVAGIAAGWVGVGKWMDSRAEVAARDDRIEALEDDNAALVAALAEQTAAQAAAGVPLRLVAERPDLRVIPPQRVSDDDWFAELYDENGEHRG